MSPRIVLFGACDRHNLGDLLLPHVVAALLPARDPRDAPTVAGLVSRDLRALGGHAVVALPEVLAPGDRRPLTLIHVGGELLTCTAWQAAVMLQPAAQVQPVIAHLQSHPHEKAAWIARQLGRAAAAPYVVSRACSPRLARLVFNAVGGVDLAHGEPTLRAEVLASLRTADRLAVRDRATCAALAAAGLAAPLLPDPAVMVATLFAARIRAHQAAAAVAAIRAAHPRGYLALQFSADFGDDRTLAALAAALDSVARDTGLGLVLFRAGAAPWHDDIAVYRRLATHLQAPASVFESLDIWDLCALIAASRGYCGSSLHGRIVALAHGLPRVGLARTPLAAADAKHAAFAQCWDAGVAPGVVTVAQVADALRAALQAPPERLQAHAAALAATYRAGFDDLMQGLT